MERTIWTVGHSKHPMETFLGLLEGSSIRLVADVRRFPGSRRHPQFRREAPERHCSRKAIALRSSLVLPGRGLSGRNRQPIPTMPIPGNSWPPT
jgi:uncharacterized protein (DUF488 family)